MLTVGCRLFGQRVEWPEPKVSWQSACTLCTLCTTQLIHSKDPVCTNLNTVPSIAWHLWDAFEAGGQPANSIIDWQTNKLLCKILNPAYLSSNGWSNITLVKRDTSYTLRNQKCLMMLFVTKPDIFCIPCKLMVCKFPKNATWRWQWAHLVQIAQVGSKTAWMWSWT